MSDPQISIPTAPRVLASALKYVPLAPLSLILSSYACRVAKNHPSMMRRLGEHNKTDFVLDPTDLPISIEMNPNRGYPRITVVRGNGQGTARIAGPLAALMGLVHGAFDGDALFFSRDLVIEGDTAATLALRNAIDDAELDLGEEMAGATGPFARQISKLLTFVERKSGVPLTRPQEVDTW